MKTVAVVMGNRRLACEVYSKLVERGIETLAIVNPGDVDSSSGVSFAAFLEKNDVSYFRFKSLKSQEAVDFLEKYKPNLAISCSYEKIVPPSFLHHFKRNIFNFHAADLPKNRGCLPVVWSLFESPRRLCMTLHELEAGLDTGAIIEKSYIENRPDLTAIEAYDLLVDAGIKMFDSILPRLLSDVTISRTPQDETIATYHPQVFPWDRWVNFSESAKKNCALINACTFFPHPSARAKFGTIEIQLLGPCRYESADKKVLPPGTLEYDRNSWWLHCIDGRIFVPQFRLGNQLIASEQIPFLKTGIQLEGLTT